MCAEQNFVRSAALGCIKVPSGASKSEIPVNIDEAQIERHLTAQTKAIVVVHYGGIGCEMEVIADCAARHGIPVVEDNAHGLFGRYRDRYLGTFGQLAALSFHETKNYT